MLTDGTVRLSFAQSKQTLTLLREVAAGHPNALPELCQLFNRNTDNGANMGHYHDLVMKALQSIQGTFTTRALQELTATRGGLLPPGNQRPTTDGAQFDLLTWLVILAPPAAPNKL